MSWKKILKDNITDVVLNKKKVKIKCKDSKSGKQVYKAIDSTASSLVLPEKMVKGATYKDFTLSFKSTVLAEQFRTKLQESVRQATEAEAAEAVKKSSEKATETKSSGTTLSGLLNAAVDKVKLSVKDESKAVSGSPVVTVRKVSTTFTPKTESLQETAAVSASSGPVQEEAQAVPETENPEPQAGGKKRIVIVAVLVVLVIVLLMKKGI